MVPCNDVKLHLILNRNVENENLEKTFPVFMRGRADSDAQLCHSFIESSPCFQITIKVECCKKRNVPSFPVDSMSKVNGEHDTLV